MLKGSDRVGDKKARPHSFEIYSLRGWLGTGKIDSDKPSLGLRRGAAEGPGTNSLKPLFIICVRSGAEEG